ncbi:MAG: choice-of-anchor D domain-containing protein [Ilumatobacteraceae bacterium]
MSRSGDEPGDGDSRSPSLDDTGRLVVFETAASNLLAPSPVGAVSADAGDLLLADLGEVAPDGTAQAPSFARVTVQPDGQPASAPAAGPGIVLDGSCGGLRDARARCGGRGPGPPRRRARRHRGGPGPGRIHPEPGSAAWSVVAEEYPVSVSTTDLDLGTTPVGGRSATWYTTVANTGDAPFVPGSITSTNDEFQLVGGTCRPDAPLLPGESCTIEVAHAPTAEGLATTEIVVAERDHGGAEVAIDVSGAAGVPSLQLTPTSSALGPSMVGVPTTARLVTVANLGVVAATVSSFSFGGDAGADFTVVEDHCTGQTLEPSVACDAMIVFTPTTNGPRHATFTVSDSTGSTSSAVVSGVGEYTPVTGVARPSVAAGGRIEAGGLGFPPDSFVSVRWSGTDLTTLIATDARGEFTTRLTVPAVLTAGSHHLTFVDPSGRFEPVNSPEFLVVRPTRSGGASPAVSGD